MPKRAARKRDGKIVAVIKQFRDSLSEILASATANTVIRADHELTKDDQGRLLRTVSNQAILRRIDRIFMDEADKAGLDTMLTAFVSSFSGQLPQMKEIFDAISRNLKRKLPLPKFSAVDEARLISEQKSARQALRTAIESAAKAVQNQLLLSVGGISHYQLVELFSKKMQKTIGQAETVAMTAMQQYYATIAARAFNEIEAGLPEGEVPKYIYAGPLDHITRPFCRQCLKKTRKKGMTREDIAKLDNGQIPDAFTSRGGWNCRHQWLLADISPRG